MITFRCLSCGAYWKCKSIPRPDRHIFKCPNGHFSEYTIDPAIVVECEELTDTKFIPREIGVDLPLVDSELKWIKKQTAKFYDCGFFQYFMKENSPIPALDLGKIERPSEPGRIRDEVGNIYRLAISPNGIVYYILEGRIEDDKSKT